MYLYLISSCRFRVFTLAFAKVLRHLRLIGNKLTSGEVVAKPWL